VPNGIVSHRPPAFLIANPRLAAVERLDSRLSVDRQPETARLVETEPDHIAQIGATAGSRSFSQPHSFRCHSTSRVLDHDARPWYGISLLRFQPGPAVNEDITRDIVHGGRADDHQGNRPRLPRLAFEWSATITDGTAQQ
jgi:hypothetical protein